MNEELEQLRTILGASPDRGKIWRLVELERADAIAQNRPRMPTQEMRKVHSHWTDDAGDSIYFSDDGMRYAWFSPDRPFDETWPWKSYDGSKLVPVGKTWAEVEALAGVKP